jgi:hypothetical protein
MRFCANGAVSSLSSSVDVRTPADASVEITGLSMTTTSGALPCCAARSVLFVRSEVS